MRLYRLFVIILIGSLIIGSIVSIGIFLFGEFGSTESRILGSIASLGFFSLAGLCSSTVADIERYRKVSIAGAISSIVAFQLVIGAIWELMEMDWFGKPIVVSIILAIALAHIALLLWIKPRSSLVSRIRSWTVISIVVLTLLLVIGVIAESFEFDFFIRMVGVVAILDVLGTVLVPILHYTLADDHHPSGSINYDNRKFRVKSTSESSETDTNTIFHYKQEGHLLTCEYQGGKIQKGHLLGTVDKDGKITMRYHQINTNGELMTGICTSTPEVQSDGKLILHEDWEWTSGNKSKGSSQLIEI